MRKLLILALAISGLFSNDFWETGWHQGNSMYHIENSNADRLELACNYEGSSFNWVDENEEISEVISFIINDESKITIGSSISIENRTSGDDNAWANLMSELPNAKKFIIQSGDKSYIFEPKNSKKALENVSEVCLEYLN